MNRDFTFSRYKLLLQSLKKEGYVFLSFSDYLESINRKGEGEKGRGDEGSRGRGGEEYENPDNVKASGLNSKSTIRNPKFVILRHDVDAKPQNSLRFAHWEHDNSIRGTYYFRSGPTGFDKTTIREIASLGHETGYHYETLDQVQNRQLATRNSHLAISWQIIKTLWNSVLYSVNLCVTKKKLPIDKQTLHHAYQLFTVNLRKLRRIVPVSTICMHGSPLSPYDNREIWKSYDYRKHDILGEATMDTDFSQVAYLTDTGRRWDGHSVSVRDKIGDEEARGRRGEGARGRGGEGETDCDVVNKSEIVHPKSEIRKLHAPCSMPFHSTIDLISAIQKGSFPAQLMLTVHPQRWNDEWWPWFRELVFQNMKNPVKRFLIAGRKKLC